MEVGGKEGLSGHQYEIKRCGKSAINGDRRNGLYLQGSIEQTFQRQLLSHP